MTGKSGWVNQFVHVNRMDRSEPYCPCHDDPWGLCPKWEQWGVTPEQRAEAQRLADEAIGYFAALRKDGARPQDLSPTGNPAVTTEGNEMTEYIVVLQRVSGPGFTMVYSSDLIRFPTRDEAIGHGWRTEDSDDFNIGTVVDGRLVAFGWGADDFGPDRNGDPHGGYDLEEISREIGLGGNDA